MHRHTHTTCSCPSEDDHSILGGKPLDQVNSGTGLCSLAKMGMPGKIPFPAESSLTGTVKHGASRFPWSRC